MSLLRCLLAAFALLLLAEDALAQNMLFVRDTPTSYKTYEQDRVTQFEAWGYTVTPIHDNATQTEMETAASVVDVVFVSGEGDAPSVLHKLRNVSAGVMSELKELDDEFGFTSGEGATFTGTVLELVDYDLDGIVFSGNLTIVGTTQNLSQNNTTFAPGLNVVSRRPTGEMQLGVLEVGATLANTHNGNVNAAGRRLRLPWSGPNFPLSSLNANGMAVLQYGLAWVAAEPRVLLAHWKLDETTGSLAADATENGHDATVSGTPVWDSAIRDNGITFDGSNELATGGCLGDPASVTLAAWVNLDAAGTQHGEVISLGDNILLRANGNNTQVGVGVRNINGSGWDGYYVSKDLKGTGWRHLLATFDDGGDVRLYLDGELIGSWTVINSIHYYGNNTTTVGAHAYAQTDFYLQGSVDDARVYNYALSESEIADVYGLVGHWTFDEGTGTTIADASLKANNASFNTGTPAWITGIRGSAIEFDGTSDAVTGANFDPPAEGTVAFWIRSDGKLTDRKRPWGVGADYEVWQNEDGYLSMDVSVDGYQGGFCTNAMLDSPNRWYHIVSLYNSADDSYKIYVDGQLDKSGISTWDIVKRAAGLLTFGTRTGSTQRYVGALDDFRIYNRQITEEEIARLYGLVGHWKLDEDLGLTAIDSSGLGYDGTYTGGAAPGGNGPYPAAGANAVELEGNTGDQIDLPEMEHDFSGGFTVATWVKPSANLAPSQTYAFFDLSNGGNNDEIWFGWVEASGLQLYITDTADGSTLKTIEDNTGFEVDGWVHCVAVVDAAGNASLYRNGVLTKTGFHTGLPKSLARTQNTIASSPLNDNLPGWMHDVRLYDRALSVAEIVTLYGQVGWWKFDETTGSVAYDSSGMNHDATNAGVSSWEGGRVDGAVDLPAGASDLFSNSTIINDLNGAKGFGAMIWVKADQENQDRGIFYGGSTYVSGDALIGLRYDQAGLFGGGVNLLKASVGSPTGDSQTEGESSTQSTAWQHLAMSWLPGSRITVWINGVEQVATFEKTTATDSLSGVEVLSIGIGAIGSNWDGKLDQFRVFNRPISQEEVLHEYNSAEVLGIQIVNWVEVQ